MGNKIFKSVFTLALSVMLLSACNNNPTEDQNNKKEKIHIAAILPLTGNAAVAGEYSKNGLQLAVGEINAAGGINGSLIEIKFNDSKGDAKEGVNLLMKANIGDTKPSIIYSQLSNVSLAIKPITERNKQILIGVSGALNLLDSSKNTLRNYIDPILFTDDVAHCFKDSMKIHSISILYSNNDFGRSIFTALEGNLAKAGIAIDFKETYDENALDYKQLVLKLKNSKSKTVYVVGIGKSLGLVYKQLKEYAYLGKIFGGIETTLPDVKSTIGNMGKGISYFDFAYDPHGAALQNFTNNYIRKFNQDPQMPAILAYAFVYTLKNNYDSILNKGRNASTKNTPTFPIVQLINGNFIHPIKLKEIK